MTTRTEIPIDRGDVGVRIDRVLLRHLAHIPGITRNRLQQSIENGRAWVNGQEVRRPSRRIAAGDSITVELPARRARASPRAENIPLSILYEDYGLVVVDKPPGQVSHPAFRNPGGTLLNALLAHAQGNWKPALLSRLDKDTSGLVLVAKSAALQAALQRIGHANGIDKEYLAIVIGRPPVKGAIDLALDCDPWDRRRVTVRDRGGIPSVTRFERVRSISIRPGLAVTLLKCRLVTGRTHQIRVHLAARGWPIVGDATYGVRATDVGRDIGLPTIDRQALHAWRIEFPHPGSGNRLEVIAPMPADMARFLEAVGLSDSMTLRQPSARAMSLKTVPSAE